MDKRVAQIRKRLARVGYKAWSVSPFDSTDKWIEIGEPGVRVDYDDVDHKAQRDIAYFIADAPADIAYLLDLLDKGAGDE